jgi:hypothetical protein
MKSCLYADEEAAHDFLKTHGERCHFTPPSRRVQRKPREVKETRRLLQARLEKAESLLHQAGLAGYGAQTPPSTLERNANSGTESATAPPKPGVALNHTLQGSFPGNDNLLVDQQPDNAAVLSQNPFPDNSGSPLHRRLEPANSSTTINADAGGSRASPHGTGFEYGTMAVDYSNTPGPPVVSPDSMQFRASRIATNRTEVPQPPKPAFPVNVTESTVRDSGLMRFL